MRIKWQSTTMFIFFAALVAIQIIYWVDPVVIKDILAFKKSITQFVRDYPGLSIAAYLLFYIISILFGLPVSITIIGGYFFGERWGMLYSMIGILVGTTLLCTFIRKVMGDWIQKRYKEQLKPFNEEIDKYGMQYVMIVNLIPFMPSFLPNLAAGLSSLPLTRVVTMSVIGAFPLTYIYSLAGAYMHSIKSWDSLLYYITFFGALLGVLFLAAMLYQRLFLKNSTE